MAGKSPSMEKVVYWSAQQRQQMTPQERRRVYKREWMKRFRKDRKDPNRSGVKVYLTKELLAEVEALRPKGRGTSQVVVELVREALAARKTGPSR
jgi:hypothetical protein